MLHNLAVISEKKIDTFTVFDESCFSSDLDLHYLLMCLSKHDRKKKIQDNVILCILVGRRTVEKRGKNQGLICVQKANF